MTQCLQPSGYILDNSDCDDDNAIVTPNTVWYQDFDGDGYGNATVALIQCPQPNGYLLDNTDCDDTDPVLNPLTIWYEDVDGDGFGNPDVAQTQCSQPAGYVLDDQDCDDGDAAVGGDQVNMQTQNLFLELRPRKNLFINVGLQRLFDNIRVPWYTFTDELLNTGYRLAFFGTDAAGAESNENIAVL